MRRIALAAALAALPAVAAAQSAPAAQPAVAAPPGATAPGIRPAPPSTGAKPNPRPKPPHHANRGNGTYAPAVVINADRYIATPNPHKTPFHNTTHVDIPPGEEIFSSQSTGKDR